MNAQLVIQVIGGAGFLAGVAALLHFINTAKPSRDKSSADAYIAYRGFVGDAMGDVTKENSRLAAVVRLLVDLVLDLVRDLRGRGATTEELDPYLDRLDEARATK